MFLFFGFVQHCCMAEYTIPLIFEKLKAEKGRYCIIDYMFWVVDWNECLICHFMYFPPNPSREDVWIESEFILIFCLFVEYEYSAYNVVYKS